MRDDALNVSKTLAQLGVFGHDSGEEHFKIGLELGAGFLARSPSGRAALLVPLARPATAVGFTTAGAELYASNNVNFDVEGRSWMSPAAIFECRRPELLEAFIVVVVDVARRLEASRDAVEWDDVLELIRSWQTLFEQKRTLSASEELGLWGEIWFLLHASEPDALLQAWRGPLGAAIDFVRGGIGVEIKTTTTRLRHEVSQSQVGSPLGDCEIYLVSIWVNDDAGSGRTLPVLVAMARARLSDRMNFEKLLAQSGYSDLEESTYVNHWAVLEAPGWIPIDRVPRVRTADQGVSHLRYRIEICDEDVLPRPAVEQCLAKMTAPAIQESRAQ